MKFKSTYFKVIKEEFHYEEGSPEHKLKKKIEWNFAVMIVCTILTFMSASILYVYAFSSQSATENGVIIAMIYALIPPYAASVDIKKKDKNGENYTSLESLILVLIGAILGFTTIILNLLVPVGWNEIFINVGFEMISATVAGVGISLTKTD